MHLLKRTPPALVGLLVAGLLAGQALAESAVPPTSEFVLDNGMAVIVKPDHRSPTAVHMLWVRTGAMDEVDGTSGVAHVLEHMMFKGTDKLGPGEFSRRVAQMGGLENAFTSSDYTAYFQQVPADKLAEAMALEADRFAHNQYSDAEFDKEIQVVQEERRMRTEDNPRALLREQQMAATFVASPYHRPVVGWMGDLQALTADDVRAFYQAWYVPANAAVVVVGDVDPQAVRAQAEKLYGAIPARAEPVRKPRPEPEQPGERRIAVKAPAEQAVVSLAFRVPQLSGLDASAQNDAALALTALAEVLDGYEGARLQKDLTRGPDRVADAVSASNGLVGRGPQLFTLSAVVAPGKTAQQAEQALRAEIRRVAEEGVTDAELERVKNQWVASEIYKRDSVMGQAMELGMWWAQQLPLDADELLVERLRQVTPAQVQEAARTWFGDDQLTVATLVPQQRADSGPAQEPPAAAPPGDVQE